MPCRTLLQHLTHLHSPTLRVMAITDPAVLSTRHTPLLCDTGLMESHVPSTLLFPRSCHVPSKPPTHGSPRRAGTWACLARLQRPPGQPCVSVSLSPPPLPGNASDFVMNRPFVSRTPQPALLLSLYLPNLTAPQHTSHSGDLASSFPPPLPIPSVGGIVLSLLNTARSVLGRCCSYIAALAQTTEIGSQGRNSLEPTQQLRSLPGDIPVRTHTHTQSTAAKQKIKVTLQLTQSWGGSKLNL